MVTTAEEAFVELVWIAARLLEYETVPDCAIGFGLLEDDTYEVCVYEGIEAKDEKALRIKDRCIAGTPHGTISSNYAAVIDCIDVHLAKHGLRREFVFREWCSMEHGRPVATWTLVHRTTLFARYLNGATTAVSRSYDE